VTDFLPFYGICTYIKKNNSKSLAFDIRAEYREIYNLTLFRAYHSVVSCIVAGGILVGLVKLINH